MEKVITDEIDTLLCFSVYVRDKQVNTCLHYDNKLLFALPVKPFFNALHYNITKSVPFTFKARECDLLIERTDAGFRVNKTVNGISVVTQINTDTTTFFNRCKNLTDDIVAMAPLMTATRDYSPASYVGVSTPIQYGHLSCYSNTVNQKDNSMLRLSHKALVADLMLFGTDKIIDFINAMQSGIDYHVFITDTRLIHIQPRSEGFQFHRYELEDGHDYKTPLSHEQIFNVSHSNKNRKTSAVHVRITDVNDWCDKVKKVVKGEMING